MTTEAIVNTVNTEGVMGKGLALEFKLKYPQMYLDYRSACRNGRLKTGQIHSFRIGEWNPQWCLNFPTKTLWRLPSKIEYITEGLKALEETVNRLQIKSIAIPKLGCSLGGLSWPQVHEEIVSACSGWDITVHIMGEKP